MTILPFALAGLGCAILSNPPRRRRRRSKLRRARRNPAKRRYVIDPFTGRRVSVKPIRVRMGGTVRRTIDRDSVPMIKGRDGVWRARRTRRNPMTPETFLAEARASGCIIDRVEPSGTVITLTKRFTPGDKAGYTNAEGACSLVYSAPGKGGSVWGTDGGSIGGYVGLKGGYCTLNKSGVQKRWLEKLRKLIAAEGRTNPRRRRR